MAWPDFLLAMGRGASLAAVLSMFGTLVFRLLLRAADALPALRRLVTASFAVAVVLTLAWLLMQSAVTAGADDLLALCTASPTVAFRSQFGHLVFLRLLLLTAAMLLRRRQMLAAAVLAGSAIVLQPFLGHAAAMGGAAGVTLIAAEALHLLAAGAWAGGLVPLLIAVWHLPAQDARAVTGRFTWLAVGCVVALASSGLLQSWDLIGGLPGLVGTAYGRVALLKFALVFGLLGFAVANRRLSLRGRLVAGIAMEAALGLTVVLVAGTLASLAPSIHQQPVWPFSVRLSLDALSDPSAGRETTLAALGMGVALILGGACVLRIRRRRLVLAASALLVIVSARHLGLLFIDAYPTTFYSSPTEFGDSGIVRGATLFAGSCVACHGSDGRGDGPDVRELPVKPADLTAAHLWAHTDGDLFWFLSSGIPDAGGRLLMPGFARALSSDARWDIIDYLHAHNAGVTLRTAGAWSHPPPMPQFDAVCGDGRAIDLDDMRGKAMLVVAGDPDVAAPARLTVIALTRRRSAPVRGGACVAREPDTWAALAILLGVSQDGLTGAQILVDPNGWLRLRAMPGRAGGWIGDTAALDQALTDIEAHPVQIAAGHHHH